MVTSSFAVELGHWDAVLTADKLRSREVSPREVLEAARLRAEAVAHLGAVVAERFAQATAETGRSGPFAFVPTFIKDLAHVKGLRTQWGSRASGSFIARKHSPITERFDELGFVTLGKSATPELGLIAATEPLSQAPCRNPWDPNRSPGGSSGGAGCLVAAGVVPLAHASDGGGSIRIPAAVNGLVGLKPSRRRLDMEGSNLLPVNIATDGVLTRSVRDTIAFYQHIERARPPRGVKALGAVPPTPERALRIGVFVDSPIGTTVDEDVKDSVLAAARSCEELGHNVESIACPFTAQVVDDFLLYWGLAAWLQKVTARVMLHRGFDQRKLEPWTLHMAQTFREQPRVCAEASLRLRSFQATYAQLFQRFDVVMCPTVASAALPIGHLATDLPYELVRARLRTFTPFTPIQNASGAPAISLPLGRSASGLPIGVQFAAAWGEDALLLSLARSLEERCPWPKLAPVSAPSAVTQ